MIFNAATKTKGSAGPSGMHVELYRRVLCSKNFKAEGKVLREEIAVFTRKMLKIAYHQEPIKWSLHLSYKPLESTLPRVDL